MEMELRSSRSRSKTPFSNVSVESEVIESEKIVRTTRSSTKIVEKITDDVMVNSVKPPKYKATKAEKSSRKKLKTSDYSSEEGENVVSTSHTITQNEKNYFLEEARAAANGSSKISALDLYRKAGRYWDVYPKTDWTYSPHSKDRVEIAPGVVAMPNMSRRSLHNNIGGEAEFSTLNKYTNTERYDTTDSYSGYTTHRRSLFNNNHEHNTYEDHRGYSSTSSNVYKRTTISRLFIGVYTTIIALSYYLYKKHNAGVFWLLKKIHGASSHVMLYDTWLLKSRRRATTDNKLPLILALCLVPLFLLGGWWLLGNLSNFFKGFTLPGSSGTIWKSPLQENIHVRFTPDEIAASLTDEQLNKIASSVRIDKDFDYEYVIERILESPKIKAVFNGNINDYDSLINALKEEVDKIRYEFLGSERERNSEMNRLVQQLRFENMQNTARLTHELKRCCRHSFVNIESHVVRVLNDVFGQTGDENDLKRQLHALFVAKQDLEARLSNVTQDLSRHFDGLITESGRKIMDEITVKLEERFKSTTVVGGDDPSGITDGYIREIVRSALDVYDADKTGLVDYAMEPLGGQILSTRCTESYSSGTAVISILGIPLWHPTNSPRTVITPGIKPGECWAFQNFPGFLLIKLVSPIQIEAFTLEHVSKSLVPDGKIDSAPKEFEVYGLKNETDKEPTKLGSYKYDYNGKPLQTFAAHVHGLIFDTIELRILANHGNPNFTCLYRFRVHGKLWNEPT